MGQGLWADPFIYTGDEYYQFDYWDDPPVLKFWHQGKYGQYRRVFGRVKPVTEWPPITMWSWAQWLFSSLPSKQKPISQYYLAGKYNVQTERIEHWERFETKDEAKAYLVRLFKETPASEDFNPLRVHSWDSRGLPIMVKNRLGVWEKENYDQYVRPIEQKKEKEAAEKNQKERHDRILKTSVRAWW